MLTVAPLPLGMLLFRQGPLSLACLALGVATAAAPPRVGLAVIGAVGDALSEHYNEQLRQLNEAGAAQEV
jgi:ubiquinone biosynthesis monooxygenase Coq7